MILSSRFLGGAVSTGTPLSDLEVGTSVYINENGSPVEYLVVNQGIPENSSLYDASCDGTWVLRKDIYENHQWNNTDANVYANNTIQPYLNETFLNLFDSGIREAIKQVKIPYVNGTGNSPVASGASGLSTKIFLLSGYEVGFTISLNLYFPIDGAKLSYFQSGNNSSANSKRIAYMNSGVANWWLRSPYTIGAYAVWYVTVGGVYDNWSSNYTHGIRPAMIFPFETTVDSNMLIA